MHKIIKIFRWAITIFFLLMMMNGGAAAVFFGLAALCTVPINKLIQLKKHFKIKPILSVILAAVLFFVGIALVPPPDTTEAADTEDTITMGEETVCKNTDLLNLPGTEPETSAETAAEEEEEPPTVAETEPETQAEPVIEPIPEVPVVMEPAPEIPVTEMETEPETTAEPVIEQPAIPSTFSIHFLDVGQADAALVECDGHYMLIDGGNKADSDMIYSVLKNTGVEKLDIVVGTHGHEDHIGGLPGAFNYTTADRTLCSVTSYDSDAFADFRKYAELNGGGITVPSVGDEYTLGSASVKILGVNGGSDPNDTSIVLKIIYGETSFLFTGDAEREVEQTILNSGADLSATVLKVGHHGSDTSTTYPFLREIMPQYAVISVGKDNSYGHPADNTLSRLRDAEVQVYRTDLHGDVYLTSDGKTVTFVTDKTASQDQIMTSGEIIVTEPEPIQPQNPVVTDPEPENTPAGTEYVLNTNTKKFHYPYCRSVKQMSGKNKAYHTGTRDEVLAMGFVPCKNCNP